MTPTPNRQYRSVTNIIALLNQKEKISVFLESSVLKTPDFMELTLSQNRTQVIFWDFIRIVYFLFRIVILKYIKTWQI